MKPINITSWEHWAEETKKFLGMNWIFRGVSNSTFKLVPSAGRRVDSPIAFHELAGRGFTDVGVADLRELEEKALADFKRAALPHLKFKPETDLEWLAVAQHHGLPTRLLD